MKIEFIKTDSLKIILEDEQYKQISSKEDIFDSLKDNDNVMGFDIYFDDTLIGFAMLNKFEEESYFLWNFAIDKEYQNKGFGKNALKALISFLKEKYHAKILTTTYLLGNLHAKHVYEEVGFKETNVIDEEDCKEVDMEFIID